MKITIIGAGIGGLTTAIALLKKGFDVEIFEAVSEIKPIGAGIILANNAMQVYQKLGLEKAIQMQAQQISKLTVADANIKALSTLHLQDFEKRYQTANFGIHRGKLQNILLQQIPKEAIFTGKKLADFQKTDQGVSLHFTDGSSHLSEIVIAADGIHSVVRKKLFPQSKIRSARQACWRGIASMTIPERYQHEVFECWGKGERFGIVSIDANTIYWFALRNYKKDLRKEFADFDITQLGENFHPFIQEILAATPKEKIFLDDITDLSRLPSWHHQNICLIGDAAHAMTPNMGQGAGQAIEDAWVLSEMMAKEKTHLLAFEKFEALRRKKVDKIVKMSWLVGKLAHWENSVAVSIRNAMVKMTPDSVGAKQSEAVFELAKLE